MRRTAGPACVLASALLALAVLPARAREGGDGQATVKIGLVDTITRGIPMTWTLMVMRPFKTLMEAQTGLVGDVVPGGDGLALAKSLSEDKVQVGVFHGHEYAWAKQKYPNLAVVALCVNKTQQAKVHLIVRADCKAASWADLKGKPIAVPRLGRAPCRVFLERRCVKAGTTPEKFFARIDAPILTQEAVNALLDQDVDAAVLDGASWDDICARQPGLARQMRSIAESEPFPCGVIAYCPGRFSEDKVARFRAGLLAAKTTTQGRSTLKSLHLTAFEAPPANHAAVLAAIARAYPAPK